MMLLSDGRVMAQGGAGNASKQWSALTPDATGNYVNGTWAPLPSMGLERLYMGSNVLPSGKVFVVGGEYSGPATTQNFTPTGEIYDPIANTWTAIPDFPQVNFGDDPTMLLPNGKILAGFLSGPQTYLYDPAANSWTQTGTKLRGDASDEETWVLLKDGSVLSYDVFSSVNTGIGHAQRYFPSTGTWADAGIVPVPLSSSGVGFELGPAALLPDGRVIQIGAQGNSAIYDPASNTWSAGPATPGGLGADDAPGAMMPNGHFLFAADTPLFNGPTHLIDFDPVADTMTDVTPNTGAFASALNGPAFVDRMLVLPSGDVLMTTSSNQLWDYTPVGSPNAAWAPTISGVSQFGNTLTVTGTQLTGLSAGSSYGDDAESDSNYPIVRLTNSNGIVKYATTFNWTPGVATGNTPTTVQFTMPAGFPLGAGYRMAVIANGIASTDFLLGLLPPQNVTAVPFPGNPTKATISWNQVSAADGYNIFLYNNSTHRNAALLTSVVGSNVVSAVVTGMAPGTKQYIVVEAYSATLAPFAADSKPVALIEPLQSPIVTSRVLSSTTTLLSWSPVTPVQGYRVFAMINGKKVLLGTLKPTATSVTLIGLKHGTSLQFMIEAFNGDVVGDSTFVTVTT